MLKLSIMTEEELAHIFGDLDAYIPLHEGKLLFGGRGWEVEKSTLTPRFEPEVAPGGQSSTLHGRSFHQRVNGKKL